MQKNKTIGSTKLARLFAFRSFLYTLTCGEK